MGKNTRRQIAFFDTVHSQTVNCDSNEECDFMAWCIEAVDCHIIEDFKYQPCVIQLCQNTKYIDFKGKEKTLFREHVYTPDFELFFKKNDILLNIFKIDKKSLENEIISILIDVKGTFQKSDGGRVFSINQKWVYQTTGQYVYKLVPRDFFKVCGCPLSCFMTKKTKQARKIFIGYKTIKQIFNID